MDCSKTEVFLSEWNRMCNANKECGKCSLFAMGGTCRNYTQTNPEDAIEIVQKWSDNNPIRTRKSVFLEAFPNAKLDDIGIPFPCAQYIFGTNYVNCISDTDCVNCWNQPFSEV